jgi:hypothetical protein
VALGLAAGGAVGGVRDLRQAEVSDEFLETVQRDLTPGKFAVVAEVSEDWGGCCASRARSSSMT